MGALESTPGTAISPPTHLLPVTGTLSDAEEWWDAADARGTLEMHYRSHVARRWGVLAIESSPLDPQTLPFWYSMLINEDTVTTPGGGTASRLHTFTPNLLANGLKTATLYAGDPNVQVHQGAYGILNELTVSASLDGSDGVTFTAGGLTQKLTNVADPANPLALARTPMGLLPGNMQVWLDTGTIGSTDISSSVVSVEQVIDAGYGAPKYRAGGTSSALTYGRVGRRRRTMTTTIQLEYMADTQRAIWAAGTTAKLRVRYYGPLIEGSIYAYVNHDSYGPLRSPAWGTYADTNRTITFTQVSQYDATAGAGFLATVMNSTAIV